MITYYIVKINKIDNIACEVLERSGFNSVVRTLSSRSGLQESLFDEFTKQITEIEELLVAESEYLKKIDEEMDRHERLYGHVFYNDFPQFDKTVNRIKTLDTKLEFLLKKVSAVTSDESYTYSVICKFQQKVYTFCNT